MFPSLPRIPRIPRLTLWAVTVPVSLDSFRYEPRTTRTTRKPNRAVCPQIRTDRHRWETVVCPLPSVVGPRSSDLCPLTSDLWLPAPRSLLPAPCSLPSAVIGDDLWAWANLFPDRRLTSRQAPVCVLGAAVRPGISRSARVTRTGGGHHGRWRPHPAWGFSMQLEQARVSGCSLELHKRRGPSFSGPRTRFVTTLYPLIISTLRITAPNGAAAGTLPATKVLVRVGQTVGVAIAGGKRGYLSPVCM